MNHPTAIDIDRALVQPAAEAVKAYLIANNGGEYIALIDAIASRLIKSGQARATNHELWESAGNIVITRIKRVDIRCRIELLYAGGNVGLQALIDNLPGEVAWSENKLVPKISAKQRAKLSEQLVGQWRADAPYGGGHGDSTIGFYGAHATAFNLNLETTLGLEHHHQRREWIGPDEDSPPDTW